MGKAKMTSQDWLMDDTGSVNPADAKNATLSPKMQKEVDAIFAKYGRKAKKPAA